MSVSISVVSGIVEPIPLITLDILAFICKTEMSLAATFKAEVELALLASHMVATVNFLNWISALGTWS
jgi:hypothetical protein